METGSRCARMQDSRDPRNGLGPLAGDDSGLENGSSVKIRFKTSCKSRHPPDYVEDIRCQQVVITSANSY